MRACSTAILAVGPTGIPWRAVAFAKAAACRKTDSPWRACRLHIAGERPSRSFLSHGPTQMDTDVLDRIYKICRSRDGAIFGCAEIRDRRDREKDKHGCLHDLKCESGVSASKFGRANGAVSFRVRHRTDSPWRTWDDPESFRG